jgi:hypothetical protein
MQIKFFGQQVFFWPGGGRTGGCIFLAADCGTETYLQVYIRIRRTSFFKGTVSAVKTETSKKIAKKKNG